MNRCTSSNTGLYIVAAGLSLTDTMDGCKVGKQAASVSYHEARHAGAAKRRIWNTL